MDFTTYDSFVAYTDNDYGNGPYPVSEMKLVDFFEWNENREAYHAFHSNSVIADCPITAPFCIVTVTEKSSSGGTGRASIVGAVTPRPTTDPTPTVSPTPTTDPTPTVAPTTAPPATAAPTNKPDASPWWKELPGPGIFGILAGLGAAGLLARRKD